MESDPTAQATREASVRDLIGLPIRLKVSDGRNVMGRFSCVDDHLNIILLDAQQILDDEKAKPRLLGQILIPGKHVLKVEAYLGDLSTLQTKKAEKKSGVPATEDLMALAQAAAQTGKERQDR
eukprot:1334668-Amorphochlora_amoeboformis.AAC.1